VAVSVSIRAPVAEIVDPAGRKPASLARSEGVLSEHYRRMRGKLGPIGANTVVTHAAPPLDNQLGGTPD
jgi:hypothetical protein